MDIYLIPISGNQHQTLGFVKVDVILTLLVIETMEGKLSPRHSRYEILQCDETFERKLAVAKNLFGFYPLDVRIYLG